MGKHGMLGHASSHSIHKCTTYCVSVLCRDFGQMYADWLAEM